MKAKAWTTFLMKKYIEPGVGDKIFSNPKTTRADCMKPGFEIELASFYEQTAMLKITLFSIVSLLLTCHCAVAQQAIWSGGNDRTVTIDELELNENSETGYSFSVWVKFTGTDPNFPCIASTKKWEQGKVIDLLSSRNMGFTLDTGQGLGWTIAIQPNGAWTWNIGDGKKQRLDYIPTAQRQKVTDDKWHLLAFTVNKSKKVARLYFDGKNVAIYSVNWFAPGAFGKNFIAGADRKEDIPACEIKGLIEDATATNRQLTDEQVFEIYRQRFPNAKFPSFAKPVDELKVMSWNIWHGARHPGIEKGVNQAVAFIKHANPDIITMQETYGSGPTIADRVGYYFYQRSDNLSIMSKYPIEETHPLYRALWFGGATIRLSEKQKMNVFCLWINHLPAWRRDSAAEGATAEALVAAEWKTRAKELKSILSELDPFIKSANKTPLLVGGDFNSPSVLDWGSDTADWHHGLEVRWPVSEQMLDLGFTDAYRSIHADPTRHTEHELWNADAKKLTYRIDYLYTIGKQIKTTAAKMMNVHEGVWASDHPTVLATYRLETDDVESGSKDAKKENNPEGTKADSGQGQTIDEGKNDAKSNDVAKPVAESATETAKWKLLWQDEFNTDVLDASKWTKCRRGRPAWRNTMSDDPRLLKITNGILHLRGIENDETESDPAPFLTAGITSKNKFSFQYGKVQIRARFKSAQGAWPALWMMGTERGWRAKGEMDLMEHLNFDDHVYQTVHSEYTLKIDKTNTPPRYVNVRIHKDEWNTYGCEWDEEKIVFTVNGIATHSYPRMPSKGERQWSFDQPFYFILSMQIGGSWVNGSGPTNPDHYPAGMEVDWIRVFQRANVTKER